MIKFVLAFALLFLLAFIADGGIVPSNLTIRVSATMVDGNATNQWPITSGVHQHKPAQGKTCHASKRDNHCGSCRACWSATVPHVSYKRH